MRALVQRVVQASVSVDEQIISGLVGMGIPEYEAKRFEGKVKGGS